MYSPFLKCIAIGKNGLVAIKESRIIASAGKIAKILCRAMMCARQI
jgi:hypothetical protein